MMKILIYIYLLLFSLNNNSLYAQREEIILKQPKFIIISNVGNSNYFVAPLVVSVDSITNITYKKGIYDLHAKYKGFTNVVVSSTDYEKLFQYLNMYQNCNKRPEKFIREEQAVLIIDYQDSLETDCKILTVKSVSTVLYTLKNLHCYLESNNFDQKILVHIERLYKFYTDTYDYKNELYKTEITCD